MVSCYPHGCILFASLPFSTLFCSTLFHTSSTWTCVDCMHQYCTRVTQCWYLHCATCLRDFQCFIALFCWICSFCFLFAISSPKVQLTTSAAMSESIKFFHFLSSLWCLDLSLCRYPKDTKPKFNNLKSKKASSFHEFARSTNDAWDIDDEEDEDFLWTPAPTSSLPSGLHSTSTQNQVATRHHFYHWAIVGIELDWNDRRYSDVFPLSRIRPVTQKLGSLTDWHLPGQKLKTSTMCRRRTQSASMSTARLSSLVVTPTSTRPQVCG